MRLTLLIIIVAITNEVSADRSAPKFETHVRGPISHEQMAFDQITPSERRTFHNVMKLLQKQYITQHKAEPDWDWWPTEKLAETHGKEYNPQKSEKFLAKKRPSAFHWG